jgi:hypothetical protein
MRLLTPPGDQCHFVVIATRHFVFPDKYWKQAEGPSPRRLKLLGCSMASRQDLEKFIEWYYMSPDQAARTARLFSVRAEG